MPDNSIGGTLDVHVASRGGAMLFKIQILALSRAHIGAKSRYYNVHHTPPSYGQSLSSLPCRTVQHVKPPAKRWDRGLLHTSEGSVSSSALVIQACF
jgi:hypothetical protein